jgi:propanol-preferring alcohol dehydrogenase
MARHRGTEVYVFTRSEQHRQLALKLGAVWAGGAEAEPPPEIDAGIVFAPAGWIVPLALKALRPGGTLALAGIHMSAIPEMPYELLYHERTVRSVANLTRQDAREVLKLAAEIPIHSEITEYPLAEANRALQDLKHGRVNGAAVLRVSPRS